jgi:hypothetical protein
MTVEFWPKLCFLCPVLCEFWVARSTEVVRTVSGARMQSKDSRFAVSAVQFKDILCQNPSKKS